jgi:hypothetical protein
MADNYNIELNLTEEEYVRAELVANIGSACGLFDDDDSIEAVIQRMFFSGLAAAERMILGGSEPLQKTKTIEDAIQNFLAQNLPEPPLELIAQEVSEETMNWKAWPRWFVDKTT